MKFCPGIFLLQLLFFSGCNKLDTFKDFSIAMQDIGAEGNRTKGCLEYSATLNVDERYAFLQLEEPLDSNVVVKGEFRRELQNTDTLKYIDLVLGITFQADCLTGLQVGGSPVLALNYSEKTYNKEISHQLQFGDISSKVFLDLGGEKLKPTYSLEQTLPGVSEMDYLLMRFPNRQKVQKFAMQNSITLRLDNVLPNTGIVDIKLSEYRPLSLE